MLFNFGKDAFQKDDFSTWWAPTLPCLREILRMSFFEMDEGSVRFSGESTPVRRVALRATAVAPGNALGNAQGVRYNLDPAVGHGFGEHLIGQLPPDASPY